MSEASAKWSKRSLPTKIGFFFQICKTYRDHGKCNRGVSHEAVGFNSVFVIHPRQRWMQSYRRPERRMHGGSSEAEAYICAQVYFRAFERWDAPAVVRTTSEQKGRERFHSALFSTYNLLWQLSTCAKTDPDQRRGPSKVGQEFGGAFPVDVYTVLFVWRQPVLAPSIIGAGKPKKHLQKVGVFVWDCTKCLEFLSVDLLGLSWWV